MAVYLLDTTAFSALMQEHERMLARVAALRSADRLEICTIVRGEIRYGLERMPRGRRERELGAKAAKLFARVPCGSVPEAAADIYARIKRDAEQQGGRLDENDLWIAATAMARGAIVVTSDSDFRRISGLDIEDWTR